MNSSHERSALFIGRFQPPHLGHLDALKQIYADGISHILLGIGSANKEHTTDNPFSYKEREQLLADLLSDFPVSYKTYPLPDTGNNEQRFNQIEENIPSFDVLYSGNPRVTDIFAQKGIPTQEIKMNQPIKASSLRNQLAMQRYDLVSKGTTPLITNRLQEIGAHKRLKEIYKQEMRAPKIATDLLLHDQQNNLILIKRKYPPYGIALPGGFIEYGEEPVDAALREGYEELFTPTSTNKKIQLDSNAPFSTQTAPNRDPRGHVISFVYTGKIVAGSLTANDDAQEIIRISPAQRGEITQEEFAFPDHYELIKSFLAQSV